MIIKTFQSSFLLFITWAHDCKSKGQFKALQECGDYKCIDRRVNMTLMLWQMRKCYVKHRSKSAIHKWLSLSIGPNDVRYKVASSPVLCQTKRHFKCSNRQVINRSIGSRVLTLDQCIVPQNYNLLNFLYYF